MSTVFGEEIKSDLTICIAAYVYRHQGTGGALPRPFPPPLRGTASATRKRGHRKQAFLATSTDGETVALSKVRKEHDPDWNRLEPIGNACTC
jgi:hypothetical protein